MSRYFFTISLVLLINTSLSGQDLPVLERSEMKGISIKQTRSFTGESLYGYIDGGADLYLEYGFSAVQVTELSKGKSNIKVEIWKMADPEAAFGIFSVSRFRCKSKPAFTGLACQNKYQLQFCKGIYYVNIINRSGSAADSTLSLTIGKSLAGRMEDGEADLHSYFPSVDLKTLKDSGVLAKGRLGISNGVPDLESFFRELSGFSALVISLQGKYEASLRFNDRESLDRFWQIHKLNPQKKVNTLYETETGEKITIIKENQVIIEFPSIAESHPTTW